MGSIRLLLALAVALYHSYGILSGLDVMTGGRVSVQAFYMISGFYMALILHEKYRPGPGSWWNFISSRFLRIFPVYWICLAIALLICLAGWKFYNQPFYLGYWISYWDKLAPETIFTFLFTNFSVLGSDWMIFTRLDLSTGLLVPEQFPLSFQPRTFSFLLVPQIWTVGIEFTFYLMAPFLVRLRWMAQLAIVFAGLGLRYYITVHKHLDLDPWTYRFFPAELAFFLAGSLGYRIFRNIRSREIPAWIPATLWILVLAGIALYPRLNFLGENIRPWCFYLFLLAGIPLIFNWTKTSAVDRWIGELSFPVYVSHHFIMFLWRQYFFEHTEYMKWFGITTALSSLGFAVLLWWAVVAPLDRYRQRRVRDRMRKAEAG